MKSNMHCSKLLYISDILYMVFIMSINRTLKSLYLKWPYNVAGKIIRTKENTFVFISIFTYYFYQNL
jgi:hypothetical protein